MNEDSGSKVDLVDEASPLAEVAIPPSVDGTGEQAATHDAITRRIRNPFLETGALAPQPDAEEETATPSLPTASPPVDPDATPLPPALDDPPPAAAHEDNSLNDNPFEAPFSEVSKNIHNLPTPLPGLSEDAADGPPKPKKHGLIVVAFVIVAGVAVDVFLWKMTEQSSAETASPAAGPDVPASAQELVGKATARPAVPIIAPLPALSHIEISVLAENAELMLDGNAVEGNKLELDVPTDQVPHALEVSAPGFAPLKRMVSFAKDLYLVIELQRAAPSRPVAASPSPAPAVAAKPAKPQKTGRARTPTEPTDEFGSPFAPTPPKRPTTTIDETDPYAP